jgi:hypothetical protein
MERGAQPGNQNAAKGRMWRDAIQRALRKRSKSDQVEALDELAEQFLDAVSKGDIQAFKELGDRLDGKPAQQVTLSGDADNPLRIEKIVREVVKP